MPGKVRAAGLLAAAFITLASLLTVSPASAATGDIELSLDGASWDSALPHAVFSDAGVLVPGDVVTRTVWARNATASAVRFTLTRPELADRASVLAAHLGIAAGYAGGAVGATTSLSAPGCVLLLPETILPPGAVARIDVRLSMANVGGTTAQNALLPFSLLATLSDPAGPAPACDAGGTSVPLAGGAAPAGGGLLAFTGGTSVLPALVVASLVAGLGAVGVAARRRRARR